VGEAEENLSFIVPVTVAESKSILELFGIGLCMKRDFHERGKHEKTKTEFDGLTTVHPRVTFLGALN